MPPKETNADSLGVARPLSIVFQLIFSKLGPSPSRTLYEINAGQGNVMCPF